MHGVHGVSEANLEAMEKRIELEKRGRKPGDVSKIPSNFYLRLRIGRYFLFSLSSLRSSHSNHREAFHTREGPCTFCRRNNQRLAQQTTRLIRRCLVGIFSLIFTFHLVILFSLFSVVTRS